MSIIQDRPSSHELDEHAHPGPRRYVQVAVVLAVFTALEVATSYLDIADALKIIMLIALATVKFALVAMFFMHLRFDNRLFTLMFVGGIALAMTAFIVVLTMQRVFFA